MAPDDRSARSARESALALATPAVQQLHRAESHGWPLSLRKLTAGGPAGNELLTGLTAAVLLAPLAVEGVTIVLLRPLISVHMFVGMVLIPPVLLKMVSTGYRFARYYTGSVPYRHKGRGRFRCARPLRSPSPRPSSSSSPGCCC